MIKVLDYKQWLHEKQESITAELIKGKITTNEATELIRQAFIHYEINTL